MVQITEHIKYHLFKLINNIKNTIELHFLGPSTPPILPHLFCPTIPHSSPGCIVHDNIIWYGFIMWIWIPLLFSGNEGVMSMLEYLVVQDTTGKNKLHLSLIWVERLVVKYPEPIFQCSKSSLHCDSQRRMP
jgi:hypothetical protein